LFIGRTALHYAAVENNMNGALLLLKHGANIEAQDEHVSLTIENIYNISFFFSLKHLYLKPHIIYHLPHGKF
jgi:ankyrin repeat protein